MVTDLREPGGPMCGFRVTGHTSRDTRGCQRRARSPSVREPGVGMLLDVAAERDGQVLLELNGEAAVDDERVPGDERRLGRAQEDDRVGDVHGGAAAPQRVLALEEAEAARVRVP